MSEDKEYRKSGRYNVSAKQREMIKKNANGVWYYEQYFRMALVENRIAGKLMSKRGGV